jgi:serine-type D-Ala-D-Ala carboxypeptidase/endopeptidase (penicillin-binding protein 4)
MKRFIITLCLLLVPFQALSASPQAEQLTYRLTELLPRDARWGAMVLDMKTGREIVSVGNTTEPLSPASLVKLFTAGAALEKEAEGKPAKLSTEILYDGKLEHGTLSGNIYLRGNGNSLLSASELRKAAETLRHKGISNVSGGVMADATHFDARGLERSREGAGYAPASALGLDLQTVSVIVTADEPGKQPHVSIEPPNPSVRFALSARSVNSGRNSLIINRSEDSSYRVDGNINMEFGPQRWRFPLADPALYVAQSFMGILQDAGVQVSGVAGKGRTPNDVSELTTIPGPTLKQFVRQMNTNSLNVSADNLLLALGSDSDHSPGTREKGVLLIRKHLQNHGINGKEADILDGSGLLPDNRIAPRAVARYLVSAARQPWFQSLYESLPRAGMEGTLRSASFKSEQFRAKSGNLENVTSLAGYGVSKTGQEIVFALIVNTPGPLTPNVRNIGDVLMRFLAE